jgi:hypothetical protein
MVARSAVKTVHHIKDGAVTIPIIDANSAVARFPKEWSFTPWGKDGARVEVEIPDGWQDLKASDRISLAVRLGAKRPGLTSAKADDLIEAEAEKRAAAAAEAEPVE